MRFLILDSFLSVSCLRYLETSFVSTRKVLFSQEEEEKRVFFLEHSSGCESRPLWGGGREVEGSKGVRSNDKKGVHPAFFQSGECVTL